MGEVPLEIILIVNWSLKNIDAYEFQFKDFFCTEGLAISSLLESQLLYMILEYIRNQILS